jgi:hypothetical protein
MTQQPRRALVVTLRRFVERWQWAGSDTRWEAHAGRA